MEKIFFKPNKKSYLFMKLFPIFGFLFIFFVIPVFIFSFVISQNLWDFSEEFIKNFNFYKYFYFWALWFIFWLAHTWYNICYKKEEYIFDNNKIIYNYWNLFSDNSVEIKVDKITEVKMIMPFLENIFFKTWHILVSTAWSSTVKTIFSNLKKTPEVFEYIQEMMRQNWFHLKKDKLVQEAKPHTLWVLFELWGKVSWIFVFLIYFIIWFFSSDWKEDLREIWKNIDLNYLYIWIWVIIILLLIPIILNFLDLKRRKYEVFTDSIFYTNWFLTKIYSFLPMEKVSDVDNHQGFFSKIFWLHDIIVSSEWSNNKVIFLNMVDWETLIKNIKYLKNTITLTEKEVEEKIEKKEEIVWFVDKTDFAIDYDREFSAKYSINIFRELFNSVFYGLAIALFIFSFTFEFTFVLPIIILSIIAWFVKAITESKFTEFILDKNTIEYKFEFLTKKHTAFTIDKVTWVIFSENIIDKIFKTCNVIFYSIGSNYPVVFRHIKKTENLEKDILSKIWISENNDFENIKVNFNLKNYILQNIKNAIWFIIFLIFFWFISISVSAYNDFFEGEKNLNLFFGIFLAIVIIFPILKYFYNKILYSSRFYNHKIFKNFYSSKSGIIFQEKIYSLFKNIKWVTSTKYPFSTTWKISLEIAWDIVIETQNQKISTWWMKISWEYLENIYDLQDKIDEILNRKELDKTLVEKSSQSIWNSIFNGILILIFIICWIVAVNLWFIELDSEEKIFINSILIFIFIIFIFFTWITIWYIKSKFYNIEKDRIMLWYGIIYKSRKTILLDRVNFVEKNQGFWWKIFKNGIVNVYTVWSSVVDVNFVDSEDFNKLYDILKKD